MSNLHVWVNPPDTELPLRTPPLRVAVGTPETRSSNSWRVWTHNGDVYAACRDAFKEFKVSLHKSGRWRFGFTAEAVEARPELVKAGADRVWTKWRPGNDDPSKMEVAFKIPVLAEGLLVGAKGRVNWPPSVVFVEPPDAGSRRLTVIHIGFANSQKPVKGAPETDGGVLAVFPIDEERSVQAVATHEPDDDLRATIQRAFPKVLRSRSITGVIPKTGILFLHGRTTNGVPWVTAVPYETRSKAN